jgi:hypothetical protein
MQEGTRGQAGTTDISSIPVDFRCNQDNVTLYLSVIAMNWAFTQFTYSTDQPVNQSTKLQLPTTIWTIKKSLVNRISAEFAQKPGFFLIGGLVASEFIFCSMTTRANGERLTFFDSHDRDEKYVQIMIYPRLKGLLQPTDRTSLGVILNYFGFGGYAGNKEHRACSQVKRSSFQGLFSVIVIITRLSKKLQFSNRILI